MDDLWYSEYHASGVRFSIKVTRQLHQEQSDYQRIAVYDSPEFGRILTLDGVLMLTERDEFIYHEMITHVPMAVNPDIRRVLVIGAGDGGAARELCKYPGIETVDVAEIDRRVTEVCREYLPQTACGFDDPRVKPHFMDGLKYVRHRRLDRSFRPGRGAVHQGVLRGLSERAHRKRHSRQPARKPLLPGGRQSHARLP
jgi:spermidine synthase